MKKRNRRILAVLVILGVIGLVISASLYQPPMRLMPPPAAFVEISKDWAGNDPQQTFDPNIALFYATNRLPVGPLDNRLYALIPGPDLHFGVANMRIGDDTSTLQRIYEWSTQTGSDEERPFIHLERLQEQASFGGEGALSPEARNWFADVDAAIKKSRIKDVIVYVHGASTTFERAAGQASQLHHFTGRGAVVVLFAWPTAENFLLYPRDMLTAFSAAPQLAKLIELLGENTAAENIDVFTYSAGGTVGSKGLAIAGQEAEKPGAVPLHLGEVYHAAPDADFRGFVDDLWHYSGKARRVNVAANMSDSALRLSQVVNGASRAGRPDISELEPEAVERLLDATKNQNLELLRVRPENIPGLSRFSHTFWYDDPWISSDVLITLLFHLMPQERALTRGETTGGGIYWTFPPDYDVQLMKVLERHRQ